MSAVAADLQHHHCIPHDGFFGLALELGASVDVPVPPHLMTGIFER